MGRRRSDRDRLIRLDERMRNTALALKLARREARAHSTEREDHEIRLRALEHSDATSTGWSTGTRWLVATGIAVAVLTVAIVAALTR